MQASYIAGPGINVGKNAIIINGLKDIVSGKRKNVRITRQVI
tara:strand:- start:302 stop:427 length:126 start_codon:yes stop_codon:yes gene_type:complete